MYFSTSFIVSVLMGAAAATSQSIAASESLLASATKSSARSLSTAGSAAAASGDTGKTHIVQVGGANGSLAFLPNNVVAQAGDLVQFQFHPKNHSVVQSTFDQPCIPIQNMVANKTDAFYSGFMPTNASIGATKNVLTYTIRVKDTKPVWYYCSQARHCQGGMVGAINAPATGNKTMGAFVALAAKAPENLSPGQAAGSGTQNTPSSPPSAGSGSGTSGSSGSGTSGASGSGTNSSSTSASSSAPSPAQVTANTAAGFGSQSFFSLGAAAIAAFAML